MSDLSALKGRWSQPKVAREVNEYHLITFDPGAIATGWAHFVVDYRGFSRPENKVLAHLKSWDCGQFTGPETEQYTAASSLVWRAKFGEGPFNTRTDVVGEDFDLVQTIGGKQLLAPVRFNAVLDWECGKLGCKYHLQNRNMRTSVTPERLNAWGFTGRWSKTAKKGKDAFSAMQHGIVWLRRLKEKSRSFPWKLSDTVGNNAYWDCACTYEQPLKGGYMGCDLEHP
jgi:hypothetical protein